MRFFFAILISICMLILFLPIAKIYQLKGYDIKNFLESMYEFKYSFKGKNKLVFTKRMARFLTFFLIFEFLVWLLIFSHISFWWLILLDFAVNILFFSIILTFLHILLLPFENLIKKYYIEKAKRKIKKFKGIKIAITGSFGKTTTKNVLFELLSTKFKVLGTPKNFNTPMGLCKTILSGLGKDTQVIIMEMGARHKGDVRELCEMFNPDVAVLTSVGEQHIETFGSLENILDTKFELCEAVSPNGICFFDHYNENTRKLYKRASCKKVGLGKDLLLKDQKLSENGSTFSLVSGDVNLKLETKLLGKFMARDIALAVMVALHLGIEEKIIKEKIYSMKAVPHRMELIKNGRLKIIDDSYNSNFNGFCESLQLLKKFAGKKILITPGIVELGDQQYELNFRIGKEIALCCDEVIIMNQTNRKALLNGINSEEKSKIKVHYADSRQEQTELLKRIAQKDSTVLFENDLPDDYA